jgi:hypothetical protein
MLAMRLNKELGRGLIALAALLAFGGATFAAVAAARPGKTPLAVAAKKSLATKLQNVR